MPKTLATQHKIIQLFESLSVWKRGSERAPHKPLLILYALGQYNQHEKQFTPYATVDPSLTSLLREFGPPRRSFHTEYPFWRLRNDGVWSLVNDENVSSRASNTDPKKSELLKYRVQGGFVDWIHKALVNDPELRSRVAAQILENHFPESIHADILDAVGLPRQRSVATPSKRDPNFRPRVLNAYHYRCAVCGLNLRLADKTILLIAAHVQWHALLGPDDVTNGVALCVLHEKMLDLGVFTISTDYELIVSDQVSGQGEHYNSLVHHNRTPLEQPKKKDQRLLAKYLEWHWEQVFRGEPL